MRSDGKVALDIALEKGHYKIAELLSAECLDVSAYSRESGRVTELMTAVLDGDMKLAWSLIPPTGWSSRRRGEDRANVRYNRGENEYGTNAYPLRTRDYRQRRPEHTRLYKALHQ